MAKASEENGEPKSMTNLPVVANRHKPVALPTSHVETVCLLSKLREAEYHMSIKLDIDEFESL